MADLDHARVGTFMLRFPDNVRPPGRHDVENEEKTGAEDIAAGLGAVERDPLHPHNAADGHGESADRTQNGPRTRIDEMIVVIRFCVRLRHDTLPLLFPVRNCRRRTVTAISKLPSDRTAL